MVGAVDLVVVATLSQGFNRTGDGFSVEVAESSVVLAMVQGVRGVGGEVWVPGSSFVDIGRALPMEALPRARTRWVAFIGFDGQQFDDDCMSGVATFLVEAGNMGHIYL